MCNGNEQVCQIYIPAATGVLPARTFYHTRLNGRYKAKIAGISYNDDTQNGDHRLITLQSNCFRMPYGSRSDAIIFGNKGDHAQVFQSWPFDLEVMGGGVDLQLISSTAYNNTGNNTFFFCIITLLVSPVE
jgi:hypothetical protein